MTTPVKARIKARIKAPAQAKTRIFDSDGQICMPSKYLLQYNDVSLNAAVIPNFCKDYLGIDHIDLWDVLCTMKTYDITAELPLDLENGWNTCLLPGAHPALNYRGKPVARTKFWLQTEFDSGMKKYGYTGWQWRTALAQRRIESVPIVIGTMYTDGSMYIGQHSDKVVDFADNAGFIVIKLGAPRRFQFGTKEGEIFYDERLMPGTAVIVGHDANTETVHSVPKDSQCKGPSGSLVFRRIDTVIPWDTVRSKIRASNYKSSK